MDSFCQKDLITPKMNKLQRLISPTKNCPFNKYVKSKLTCKPSLISTC